MSKTTVDLFVEDRAQEEFLGALVRRLGTEEKRPLRLQVRTARGGRSRVWSELRLYQRTVHQTGVQLPDLLIVGIDANCESPRRVRRSLENELEIEFRDRIAFACPDPHIERWFLADPESFTDVVGAEPPRERRKCERERYKKQLVDAVRKGGHVPTLGGVEFARDLVAEMDLYRASKNEPSLKLFVDTLRGILRRASEG